MKGTYTNESESVLSLLFTILQFNLEQIKRYLNIIKRRAGGKKKLEHVQADCHEITKAVTKVAKSSQFICQRMKTIWH